MLKRIIVLMMVLGCSVVFFSCEKPVSGVAGVSALPTVQITAQPTAQPTIQPSLKPTPPPTAQLTARPADQSKGQIYLYGESSHNAELLFLKKYELWHSYYHNERMRHLFIELPYYSAEFLNIWMQSDNDSVLDAIYTDTEGTAGNSSYSKEFYKRIKNECPETIFHGTDIGHQYDTTGERFLGYLENNNLKNTEKYILTQEAIEQGIFFCENNDFVYRENKMVENFVREFNKLESDSVMGIYGTAHTDINAKDYTNKIPCMANQLRLYYGDTLSSETIMCTEPIRVDTINVNGKVYEASYFGEENVSSWAEGQTHRQFWRLEEAYNDFSTKRTDGIMPYDYYPMVIEKNQILVVDFYYADGLVERSIFRSGGVYWEGNPATARIALPQSAN